MAKYYTELERQTTCTHRGRYLEFTAKRDLSGVVEVKPIHRDEYDVFSNLQILAEDISGFMLQWAIFDYPHLNGFSGTDCIKWNFNNK